MPELIMPEGVCNGMAEVQFSEQNKQQKILNISASGFSIFFFSTVTKLNNSKYCIGTEYLVIDKITNKHLRNYSNNEITNELRLFLCCICLYVAFKQSAK